MTRPLLLLLASGALILPAAVSSEPPHEDPPQAATHEAAGDTDTRQQVSKRVQILLEPNDAFARPDRLQEPLDRLEHLPKEQGFEELIQTAYSDLERFSEPSGKDLRFELRSFVYIPRKAFDSVKYVDVVTLPGGDEVQAGIVHGAATWTDEVRAMVDPIWTWRSAYLQSEEARKTATMSLGAVLDRASRGETSLEDITGLTAYEVTVSLGGKRRTYRAAFAWIDHKPQRPGINDVEAIIWDNVTLGVGATLNETAAIGNQESLPPAPGAPATSSESGDTTPSPP